MTEGACFRVERRWAPDALTSTAPVLDVLANLASSLLDDGAVLDALAADGTLNRAQAPTPVELAIGEEVTDDDTNGGSDADQDVSA